MTLGKLIEKARKAKKWSLQRLADEVSVSKQLVWQWEKDKSDARIHIKVLSDKLEVPIDYFYGSKAAPGVMEAKFKLLAPEQRTAVETMIEAFLHQQEREPSPPRKKA